MTDVAVAYAEQIYHRRILNRRIEFQRLVEEQESSVREQLELGRSDLTQVHEVLRYLHHARAQRIEADTAYRRAQFELARLTGAIRENLDAGGLSGLERGQPASLEAARTRGLEGAPIAGKARQKLLVEKSRMEFQRAELWPSLDLKLGGSDGYVGDIQTRDADAQLILRMPIFEGGRKFAQLRKARYAMEAAEYDLAADMEQLELNITVSWNLVNGLAQACLELGTLAGRRFRNRVHRGTEAAGGPRHHSRSAGSRGNRRQHRRNPARKAHGTRPGPRRPPPQPRRPLPLPLTPGSESFALARCFHWALAVVSEARSRTVTSRMPFNASDTCVHFGHLTA